VHDRSNAHVATVDARPQPFAFFSWSHRGSRCEFSQAYLNRYAARDAKSSIARTNVFLILDL
jgi:hypothetical protein